MYFQNEDQKTPPWRPEIRSQFLLTRTPPFLAFGLNQLVLAYGLNQLVSAFGLNGFCLLIQK